MRRSSSLDRMPGPRVSPFGVRRVSKKSSSSSSLVVQDVVEAEYSKDELKQLMSTLGLKPTQEELNQMVDEIDADGNGEIDFDEVVTVMSRKVNTSYTPTQVKAAFKVFERDCPQGYVSMSALEQALTTYGTEKLSLTDAQELLSQIEPDENGLINYVEFVNMMTQS